MNEVISSYIEESHRSLLAKKSGPTSPLSARQRLPRLISPKNAAPQLDSTNALDHVKGRAVCSISEETHEDALREINRLMKKNKTLEDDLSIITAKKMSFKAQTIRDQKELKRLTEALDSIQKDVKSQREDSSYRNEMSDAALVEISEMRETHIREVRLLQRGLQARTDESYRNRVNEIADLVDSLGRAALQRDQANKEKSKLQQRCRQATVEIKMLQEERRKFLSQNKVLVSKLKDLQRTNNVLMQPREEFLKLDEDEDDNFSDEEFETELAAFERRYSVLDEGARGLDHWVEKLHKEKGRLERRREDTDKDVTGLEKAVSQWQEVCEQKDSKIEALEHKVREQHVAFDKLHFEVKSKSSDLQLQLMEERKRYDEKLKFLQQEAEYARSTAAGYHVLSQKLQQELLKAAAGEP